MGTKTWTREMTECLITELQSHENLYNPKHIHYNDKARRSASFRALVGAIRVYSSGINAECIKKKIHTLRGQYTKEKRMVNRSKKSGAGAGNLYVPILWCYDELDFLGKHVRLGKGKLNKVDYEFVSVKDESCDLTLSPTASATTGETDILTPTCSFKKRKAETATSLMAKRIDIMTEAFKTKKANQKYDWLGKQVVCQINEIENAPLRRNTVWKIQTALKEALTEDETLKNNEQSNKLHYFREFRRQ